MTDPIGPRDQVVDEPPTRTSPATRGPNSSGRCSASAIAAMPPIAMADDDRGPVGGDDVQHRADVAAQGSQGQVAVRGGPLRPCPR